jgi:hypothetical protein
MMSFTRTHRRPVFTVLAIAAALALAGCSGGAGASTTAPTETVTVTPTATPTPTPTGPDLADPSSWTVDFTGVGPVELGAPILGTASLMTAFTVATQEACPWVTAYAAEGLPSVWLPDPQDTGVVGQIVLQAWSGPAAVAASSPKTDAGVGVGSTLAELRAAYPALTEQQGKYAVFYAVTDDAGHWINFSVMDDVVDAIVVRDEAKIDSEYCG